MCNNGCGSNSMWIIVLILILCCGVGNGMTYGNGCGGNCCG